MRILNIKTEQITTSMFDNIDMYFSTAEHKQFIRNQDTFLDTNDPEIVDMNSN